ncbi:hypothetical protein JTE90_025075 [Oedothorax gibbosus]|uniref:Uncharacterized protein n=1 Tax=Oedothorax gibbosus TaxID=931172 RepID=A0AAV6U5C7_9ARAC|nr:hypothetical protein JTE90_025075 [Oedothorax gibbosus]
MHRMLSDHQGQLPLSTFLEELEYKAIALPQRAKCGILEPWNPKAPRLYFRSTPITDMLQVRLSMREIGRRRDAVDKAFKKYVDI